MAKYTVTPWEVKGEIDYRRLIKEFGTKPLTPEIIRGIEEAAGKGHYFLRRRIFFSHRDMDNILKWHKGGKEFALYTGRGPSGKTHLGHLIPWIFCKYLQDAFGAELYFQMTDDEKFLYSPALSLEQTNSFARDNALDVIALGFDPERTFIFNNSEAIGAQYRIALEVAKRTTFSTVKAVFGFKPETNIGMIFFPSIQAAPCFLPSVRKGREVPVLIPAAIDQDPYWRGIARAVAAKMNWPKPAQIHCRFLPGLAEGGKMSASIPESAIFTTDSEKEVRKKVMNAFTGGGATIEEQHRKGGNPDICPIYHYFFYLFEQDDAELKKMHEECREGKLLCGGHKKELAERIVNFLREHQRQRENARGRLDKFMLKG